MSVRRRVLLVTDAVGGVWVYSLELARSLRSEGVESLLAVTGPSPTHSQREDAREFRLLDTGLPLDWMPTSPAELRRAGDAIAKLARVEGADLVQTCSAAILADCDFDQPWIAVQHSCVASWWSAVRGTPLPPEFAWRRDLVECGLNRAAAVIAPTASFAADTARLYDLARPVIAVHNGRAPVARRPVEQADFVLTAGRLWDEGKDAATLDAAAARLSAPVRAAGPVQGPNGAAASFAHLQTIGTVSEARMADLYAARPIYASAARYEPFGLSVLEAAQAGCALVLSDIPTHRELWSGVARFVPVGDSAGFANSLDRLLRDPEEREALGRRARTRSALFTPQAMAKQMANIYRRFERAAPMPEVLNLAGAA